MQPYIDTKTGVPFCTEKCDEYDGKRCRLMGARPAQHCEPALIQITTKLAAYERVVEAARAASFTLRNIAFATKDFAPHELSFGGERVTDYASRVAAKLVDALDAEDGQ